MVKRKNRQVTIRRKRTDSGKITANRNYKDTVFGKPHGGDCSECI